MYIPVWPHWSLGRQVMRVLSDYSVSPFFAFGRSACRTKRAFGDCTIAFEERRLRSRDFHESRACPCTRRPAYSYPRHWSHSFSWYMYGRLVRCMRCYIHVHGLPLPGSATNTAHGLHCTYMYSSRLSRRVRMYVLRGTCILHLSTTCVPSYTCTSMFRTSSTATKISER
jgi:hypothetical protein